MNLLQDIITYIRRIIKSPSDAVISDNLIIDYINRFWIMDVDARVQLFDLKTKYQFQTSPGLDQYNMPLYTIQTEGTGGDTIGPFPVYQGFMGPVFVNGIQIPFYTERNSFFNLWPSYNQNLVQTATGNGTSGPYTLNLPFLPNSPTQQNFPISSGIIRGHVDITGIIATGSNQDPPIVTSGNDFISTIPTTSVFPAVYFTSVGQDNSSIVISDSGEFLSGSQNLGLLMQPGAAPYGNLPLTGGYTQTFAITGITQANPAVITSSTTLAVGQSIQINGVGGMTQLNGNTYTVTAVSGTTVTINVDSTTFTAYTSGGTITSFLNLINYLTGVASNVFFPAIIPDGMPISSQCIFYQLGIPRAVLYNNNTLTFRAPPNTQYLVELDAYLSPAAFFNSDNAIPFGYMAEYIARGAARKILSDTGDTEQFYFYEPLFKEQEMLVWKRSQRQFTSTRSQTIYSNQGFQSNYNQSSIGI